MQRGQGFKAMQVGCKLFEEAKKDNLKTKDHFILKKSQGRKNFDEDVN